MKGTPTDNEGLPDQPKLARDVSVERERVMSTAVQITTDTATEKRDALVERLLQSTSGTMDIFTVYLGDQLGFYKVLREDGALTSTELASRTGAHERYVREWLEQQTVAGILEVEDAGVGAENRRYYLPPGHEEVLADFDNPNFLPPLAQTVVGAVGPLSNVLEAYRNGGGVPYEEYGKVFREGQGRLNRVSFLQNLGQEWIPTMPDVDARLKSDAPARVADIGCGVGWSSIGIAKAYPNIRVDGFDLDAPSIELAQANVEAAGVADRVKFHVRDAGDPELAGRYDLVMALECVHDLSRPVVVLDAMRRLAKDSGAVLVVDERVGDQFTSTGNEIEWLMYGFSVLHCLPAGMAEQPSVGTGTVMRPSTLRGYAQDAGFADIEILPIDNFFFRFYRLCM